MKVQLLLCAREFIMDQITNLVSAINLYEEIASPAFPLFIPMLSILTIATREDGEPDKATLLMRIGNEGDELFSNTFDIEFHGTKRSRHVVQFGPVPIIKPGVLIVTVSKDADLLGSYEIPMSKVGPVKATPVGDVVATTTPPAPKVEIATSTGALVLTGGNAEEGKTKEKKPTSTRQHRDRRQ